MKLRLSTDLRAVVLMIVGGVIASVLMTAAPASAAVDRWTSEGPAGGWVGTVVYSPNDPAIVLATSGSGMFKSVDGGRTWDGPVLDWHVGEIVFDPRTPTTMHGLSRYGIGTSLDGGATWTYSIEGLPGNYLKLVFTALALDPSAPETLYLGTSTGGLYKSVDNGATWTSVGGGVPDDEVASILVDPSGGGTVYVGLVGGGSYRSTNDGASWVETGIPSVVVRGLATDPSSPGTVYAGGMDGRVYVTDDAGRTWEPRGSGLPDYSVVDRIELSGSTSGKLYAAAGSGVYASTDRARTWTHLDLPATGWIDQFAVDPSDGDTVLVAGGAAGVLRTEDGGTTSSPSNDGINATNTVSLAVAPNNPDIVYAGTDVSGTFKSTDAGASWERLDAAPAGMVLDLVVDPTDPQTVYAASGGVWKSVDGGVTWSRSNAGLTIQVAQSLAIDPASPSTLYAGTQDGIFKSTDAGATWTSTSSGLKGFFKELAIGPAGNALYVGTHGSGLFRSLDGAASWGAAGTGQIDNFVSEIAVDPNAPGTVYVFAGQVIWKSADFGATWAPVGLSPLSHIESIVIDPRTPGLVYVAGDKDHDGYRGAGALFYSTTGGATWLPLGDGIESPAVNELVVAPSGNAVHAATSNGVYDLELSGPLPPTPTPPAPPSRPTQPTGVGTVAASVSARGRARPTPDPPSRR